MRRFLYHLWERVRWGFWWIIPVLLIMFAGSCVALTTLNWEDADLWEEIYYKSVFSLTGAGSMSLLIYMIVSSALEGRSDSKDLTNVSTTCQLGEYRSKLLEFSEGVAKWQAGDKSRPNTQFAALAKAYVILLGLVDGHLGPFGMVLDVYHEEAEDSTGIRVSIDISDKPGTILADVERWADGWLPIVTKGHFVFKV